MARATILDALVRSQALGFATAGLGVLLLTVGQISTWFSTPRLVRRVISIAGGFDVAVITVLVIARFVVIH